MSEQINKVLASTAQAFSTAQQKQARDNISAQAKISYSYSGSTITAIDGSAVGNPASLTGVEHDYNLSGSGTSAVPLGLSDPIKMSAQHTAGDPVSSMSLGNTGLKFEVPSAHTSQVDYNQVKVNYEWPSALDVEHSLGWYAHGEIDGGSLSLSAHDCSYISHNVITGSTNNNPYLGIYGGYGSGSLQTSIVAAAGDQNRPDPYISFGFSGSSEVVDQSSIQRWNSYSAGLFTGASANNCISGDGTSGSPLGLSATAQWTAGGNWYPMTEISAGHLKISAGAFAGAQVYQNQSSFCNLTPTGITVRHTASAVGGGSTDNFYGEILSLTYNAGEYYLRQISSDASGLRAKQNGNPDNESIFGFGSAAFSDDDGSTWEVVDPSSIRRWNSYSSNTGAGWDESGNSLSTGFGGNQVTAASQYNVGAGNWAARSVKMSGLPDQTLYGFQTRPPEGTGSYQINAAGAFVAPDLPTFNLKVYKPTDANLYLSTSDYPAMPSTADGLLILVNLGSGPNIVYPDTLGATSTIGQHNSAQLIWDSDAHSWVRWNN